MASFIRTNEADNDAVFIPALTPISSEDLEPILHPLWEEVLQELDLLSVERDDTDARLVHATLDEGLRELAHKFCLGRVLHEIADARVACWKVFSIHEDGFAAIKKKDET